MNRMLSKYVIDWYNIVIIEIIFWEQFLVQKQNPLITEAFYTTVKAMIPFPTPTSRFQIISH
jgi:hypothetical protein